MTSFLSGIHWFALALGFLFSTLCFADPGLMTSAERQHLVQILLKAHVLRQGRVLVHISQTCNLRIKGASYPVLDVQGLIPGASFAHGFNQVVILDKTLRVEQSFQYIRERPLFCLANELYVFGELAVNQVGTGGNVLVFETAQDQPTYRTVDSNTIRNPPVQ